MKRNSELCKTDTGRRLIFLLATAVLTTPGEGEGEGAGGEEEGSGGEGASEGSSTGKEGGEVDLTTLFPAEMVEARKAELAAAKAEEDRRAALTDEQRAEEDRVKTEEAAKNQVPEEYADFTVEEGVIFDADLLEEFKPLAKELGLTQEKAQKLIDLSAKHNQKIMDGILAAHEQRKASWLEAAKKDPEIGADISLFDDKDPESVKKSVAFRAFNTIAAGAPGLKAMVDELGIGNHPEFLRVFHRIGKNMREDTFEQGKGGGGGEKTIAKSLWPGMN